jgi:isocitrate/isopropylmalate dehydrogenase
MAALLVRDAARFDVIVTTNMFGDILSDEASELSGSLGLGGVINASDTHCMAQAQHGSAPDIQGQDKANPVSLVLSAAMLLDWIARRRPGCENYARAGTAIAEAIDALVADPTRRTPDLGGPLGTRAFTAALCREVETRLGAD